MRIDGARGLNRTDKKTAAKGRSSGGRFTIDSGGPVSGLSGTGGAQSISHIGTLLAVQEVDNQPSPQQRTLKRGHDMLDMLDNLKLGLLSGRVSPAHVQRLRQLSMERAVLDDQDSLQRTMQAIELRAEVELAKLAMQKRR